MTAIIIIITLFCQKNKNILFNNTAEIQLAGRQKNIKFMKLAPMLYTILNYKHTRKCNHWASAYMSAKIKERAAGAAMSQWGDAGVLWGVVLLSGSELRECYSVGSSSAVDCSFSRRCSMFKKSAE